MITKQTGVTFINIDNESEKYHTFDDFGLILRKASVEFPTPKKEQIDVPGRDGVIELTGKLAGEVKYNNRYIYLTTVDLYDRRHYSALASQIAGAVNGKHFKIILDKDKSFFYKGYAYVLDFAPLGESEASEIGITCEVEPYKYAVDSTADRWRWDPFSFYTGIISNLSGVTISGTKTIEVEAGTKRITPKITCSSAMTLKLNGQSYQLKSGVNNDKAIKLAPGKNKLTFTGNGTVTIDFNRGVF